MTKRMKRRQNRNSQLEIIKSVINKTERITVHLILKKSPQSVYSCAFHLQSVIILKKNERLEGSIYIYIYICNVMINCSYAAENSSNEIRIDIFARNLFRDS